MAENGEPERAQVVLDQLIEPLFAAAGVNVSMLRLDQYHALLSGNKYFKLKYNLRRAKALLKHDRGDVERQIQAEILEFSEALDSPESEEALAAFAEKRQPDFSRF